VDRDGTKKITDAEARPGTTEATPTNEKGARAWREESMIWGMRCLGANDRSRPKGHNNGSRVRSTKRRRASHSTEVSVM